MEVTLNITTVVTAFIAALGIPSALTGFLVRRIEKKMEKHQKEQDEKEEARKQNEIIIIESVNASIALAEATARAVQRIPDAQCNGDMHAALKYASDVKHKHRDFITQQGINALY